jgi:hypothetical protein
MTNISGQRPDEIMILKKGGMQLYVSLLVFSTRLPLAESAYLSEIVIRVPVVGQVDLVSRLSDETSEKITVLPFEGYFL